MLINSDNGPVYWLDGNFYGGDFENGTWYNGIIDEKNNNVSRFGTKSSYARKSVWKGGKLLNGQFHSLLNIDTNGLPIASDVHAYSIWESGLFTGDFYGGIVRNISFNNSIWYGGILEDYSILSVESTLVENKIILDGIYYFNIGDEFNIIDNGISSTFSVYGSLEDPKLYRILNNVSDLDNNITILYCDNTVGTMSGTPSNLRLVSNFQSSTWFSGIWNNGIFNNGSFLGGLWKNGNFSGIWG